MRRKPYSVVLLDEIEKAHPEVFNILLQIMDDGRLTDAKGRKVDFRNTIIIMTSNAGAELIRRETGLGFHKSESQQSSQEQYDKMKDKVLTEMKKLFRPEFLNRIDATVVFRALGREQIRAIVDLMLSRTQKQLTEQRLVMEATDAAKDLLMEKGFDAVFGARPMRRAIQNLIEDPLAEGLLHGRFQPGDTVLVDRGGDDLTLETKQVDARAGASRKNPRRNLGVAVASGRRVCSVADERRDRVRLPRVRLSEPALARSVPRVRRLGLLRRSAPAAPAVEPARRANGHALRRRAARCASPTSTPPTSTACPSPSSEFARVLGGGIVKGSLTLIGGDPGVGKSTLLSQVADQVARTPARCCTSRAKSRSPRLACAPGAWA